MGPVQEELGEQEAAVFTPTLGDCGEWEMLVVWVDKDGWGQLPLAVSVLYGLCLFMTISD